MNDDDLDITRGREDIYISIDEEYPQPALDLTNLTGSTTSVIDLSGVTSGISNVSYSGSYTLNAGAAQPTYSIGSIGTGMGNITIGGWDSTRSTDIVIKRDQDSVGIKLLETLELWSNILGLPLVRDGEFQHEMLSEIHKSWIESAKAGDLEQAKKYRDQFEIFEQLTKNDKKDDVQ